MIHRDYTPPREQRSGCTREFVFLGLAGGAGGLAYSWSYSLIFGFLAAIVVFFALLVFGAWSNR